MKTFVSILGVLLFFGCASAPPMIWHQAGKTETEMRQDYAECQLIAIAVERKVPTFYGNGDAALIGLIFQGDTMKAREQVISTQMRGRGYNLVPASITNQAGAKP